MSASVAHFTTKADSAAISMRRKMYLAKKWANSAKKYDDR